MFNRAITVLKNISCVEIYASEMNDLRKLEIKFSKDVSLKTLAYILKMSMMTPTATESKTNSTQEKSEISLVFLRR